uniref:Putative secreted protein n=1 Tax=Ixodes ricinus TaxID=34613 RepID=A0A6B0TUB2_IXORI
MRGVWWLGCAGMTCVFAGHSIFGGPACRARACLGLGSVGGRAVCRARAFVADLCFLATGTKYWRTLVDYVFRPCYI